MLRGAVAVAVETLMPVVAAEKSCIVVSIPACHAGDPGSIPGREIFLLLSHHLMLRRAFVLFAPSLCSACHHLILRRAFSSIFVLCANPPNSGPGQLVYKKITISFRREIGPLALEIYFYLTMEPPQTQQLLL
eukprot:scaffold62246_cov38-Tisochrysis_lutea.AAC.1